MDATGGVGCVICQDTLKCKPFKLTCGHTFGRSCIKIWMAASGQKKCMLCTKQLTDDEVKQLNRIPLYDRVVNISSKAIPIFCGTTVLYFYMLAAAIVTLEIDRGYFSRWPQHFFSRLPQEFFSQEYFSRWYLPKGGLSPVVSPLIVTITNAITATFFPTATIGTLGAAAGVRCRFAGAAAAAAGACMLTVLTEKFLETQAADSHSDRLHGFARVCFFLAIGAFMGFYFTELTYCVKKMLRIRS